MYPIIGFLFIGMIILFCFVIIDEKERSYWDGYFKGQDDLYKVIDDALEKKD